VGRVQNTIARVLVERKFVLGRTQGGGLTVDGGWGKGKRGTLAGRASEGRKREISRDCHEPHVGTGKKTLFVPLGGTGEREKDLRK